MYIMPILAQSKYKLVKSWTAQFWGYPPRLKYHLRKCKFLEFVQRNSSYHLHTSHGRASGLISKDYCIVIPVCSLKKRNAHVRWIILMHAQTIWNHRISKYCDAQQRDITYDISYNMTKIKVKERENLMQITHGRVMKFLLQGFWKSWPLDKEITLYKSRTLKLQKYVESKWGSVQLTCKQCILKCKCVFLLIQSSFYGIELIPNRLMTSLGKYICAQFISTKSSVKPLDQTIFLKIRMALVFISASDKETKLPCMFKYRCVNIIWK